MFTDLPLSPPYDVIKLFNIASFSCSNKENIYELTDHINLTRTLKCLKKTHENRYGNS